jgi:hypothetical protein
LPYDILRVNPRPDGAVSDMFVSNADINTGCLPELILYQFWLPTP